MNNSRQNRLQMLARMNRGKAAAPTFVADLSEAVGEPIDLGALLPLPQSDAVMAVFRGGYQALLKDTMLGYRRFFLRSEARLVFGLADCLAGQMRGERAFFITKQSTYCGVVSVNLEALLKRTESVIRFDGDSLSAISEDHTQGILIDHNPDDDAQAYEAAVWGDRWSGLAIQCDQKVETA